LVFGFSCTTLFGDGECWLVSPAVVELWSEAGIGSGSLASGRDRGESGGEAKDISAKSEVVSISACRCNVGINGESMVYSSQADGDCYDCMEVV